MNTKEFKVEMLRHNDTLASLAEYIGISITSLSNKINAKGTFFTQLEIMLIIERYNLNPERAYDIFFTKEVSHSAQEKEEV